MDVCIHLRVYVQSCGCRTGTGIVVPVPAAVEGQTESPPPHDGATAVEPVVKTQSQTPRRSDASEPTRLAGEKRLPHLGGKQGVLQRGADSDEENRYEEEREHAGGDKHDIQASVDLGASLAGVA